MKINVLLNLGNKAHFTCFFLGREARLYLLSLLLRAGFKIVGLKPRPVPLTLRTTAE